MQVVSDLMPNYNKAIDNQWMSDILNILATIKIKADKQRIGVKACASNARYHIVLFTLALQTSGEPSVALVKSHSLTASWYTSA